MKKLILGIILAVSISFASPHFSFAQAQFTTTYKVSYDIQESGGAKVNKNISIKTTPQSITPPISRYACRTTALPI